MSELHIIKNEEFGVTMKIEESEKEISVQIELSEATSPPPEILVEMIGALEKYDDDPRPLKVLRPDGSELGFVF